MRALPIVNFLGESNFSIACAQYFHYLWQLKEHYSRWCIKSFHEWFRRFFGACEDPKRHKSFGSRAKASLLMTLTGGFRIITEKNPRKLKFACATHQLASPYGRHLGQIESHRGEFMKNGLLIQALFLWKKSSKKLMKNNLKFLHVLLLMFLRISFSRSHFCFQVLTRVFASPRWMTQWNHYKQ